MVTRSQKIAVGAHEASSTPKAGRTYAAAWSPPPTLPCDLAALLASWLAPWLASWLALAGSTYWLHFPIVL